VALGGATIGLGLAGRVGGFEAIDCTGEEIERSILSRLILLFAPMAIPKGLGGMALPTAE